MVMCPKDVNGMANIEDPDQTAPRGAVQFGSALFAMTMSVRKTYVHYSTLFSSKQEGFILITAINLVKFCRHLKLKS